jgi:preprotein translocase subunit SecA
VALEKKLLADYAIKISIKNWLKKEPSIAIEEIANRIKEMANQSYLNKEKLAGSEAIHHFERSVMLQIIDHHWRSHLSSLDQLRQGIGLRAYGQKDPKQEFKKEAFGLFEKLLDTIKYETTRVLMLVQIKDESEASNIDKKNNQRIQNAEEQKRSSEQTQIKKVGRNELCPCGSQKKYKHCHGTIK